MSFQDSIVGSSVESGKGKHIVCNLCNQLNVLQSWFWKKFRTVMQIFFLCKYFFWFPETQQNSSLRGGRVEEECEYSGFASDEPVHSSVRRVVLYYSKWVSVNYFQTRRMRYSSLCLLSTPTPATTYFNANYPMFQINRSMKYNETL